jgi:hypothetical protein
MVVVAYTVDRTLTDLQCDTRTAKSLFGRALTDLLGRTRTGLGTLTLLLSPTD